MVSAGIPHRAHPSHVPPTPIDNSVQFDPQLKQIGTGLKVPDETYALRTEIDDENVVIMSLNLRSDRGPPAMPLLRHFPIHHQTQMIACATLER